MNVINRFVRGRSGLWGEPDFVRFWSADTLSWMGSQINLLALPLIAALTLDASAFEVGALAAAGQAPLFLIGLFAGAWVERRRRRPILIAADLARAILLMAIPIAAIVDQISMPLLYAVAFSVGICSVFFDVSYLSFLPSLVGRDRLVEANSRLEASASGAQVAGPFLGGVLVGSFTAPVAILVDAVSYLVSALLLRGIETEEPEPVPPPAHETIWQQIGQGLRFVGHEPTLRALAGCSAVTNFSGWIFLAVYILFMERELGLGATAIGLVFASGGVGALIGSIFAERLASRFGTGWTLVGAQFGFGVTGLLVPVAVLVPSIGLPLVVAAEFLQWMTLLVYAVNAISLRQRLTPDALLGRVNATFTFVARGVVPIGSLIGGVLGGVIGLPLTLVVGEIGMFLAVGLLLISPLVSNRDPEPVSAPAEPALG
ncbi:MAG: MFS transporter [Thermomicrobiales bacterium]|nr:MFS transporter [Thermomicrobiales bacterium]